MSVFPVLSIFKLLAVLTYSKRQKHVFYLKLFFYYHLLNTIPTMFGNRTIDYDIEHLL